MELPVKDGNGLPGADRLLGLVGVKEDLNVVNDICVAALDLLADDLESIHSLDERGRTWLHAYYVSAVVTYARCFTSGPRTQLEEVHVRRAAGDQAEAALEVHRALLLTRDKHLAHPVSPYEDGVLGVIVRPDGTPYGLDPQVYKQTVSPPAFGQLRLLVGQLLPVVNELILKRHAQVMREARRLSVADLAALPEAEWIPPGVEDLGRSRKEPRAVPAGGAWGYVRRVSVADDAVDGDQEVRPGADGPMRHRQVWTVQGVDRDASVVDLGVKPTRGEGGSGG